VAKMNGILMVDKPTGVTSHDVVYKLRKHIGQQEVGHAGTLDPLASGLLVLLLGEGTKLSRLILSQKKSYLVTVKLGLLTDSWDTDGKTLIEEAVNFSEDQITKALNEIIKMEEFPLPIFSAVKIKGKKLYEYARSEQEVEVPKRVMSFYDLKILNIKPDEVQFEVSCNKGGYIRSLAYVLGEALNSCGTVSYLRRSGSHPYKIENALTLEESLKLSVEELANQRSFESVEDILIDYKALTVSGRDETLMKNGAIPNEILRRMVYDQKQVNKLQKDEYIRVIGADEGRLISLLHLAPNTKPKVFRKFNK